jgi:Concanavalin A-like lectin/glucanases superfamily
MKTKKILLNSMILLSSVVLIIRCGDDVNPSLPPIGGYDSADEVGAPDLVAYWSLDGNGKENISNTSPSTTTGAEWETGVKGKGVKLTNGYLAYPSITALTSNMNAYSISSWVKLYNNQTETSGSVSTIFSLARPNEWIGNINLYAETGQKKVENDSIKIKQGFSSSTSGVQVYENFNKLESWMVEDNLITPGKHVAGPNKIGGQWAHIVATWDGSNNTFIIYSNGQKISSPAFEIRGDNTSIVLDTPTTPIIGAFGNHATTPDAWNKPMTGNIDELRVFKKALTRAEIGALYELELAGR